MGTLTDVGLLIFGLLAGWLRYRRPLSSAWSRASAPIGKSSYRETPQDMSTPGASRFVRLLVAYVHTLALFAAARIVLAWVDMQEIYNRGHEQAGLVPEGARGIVLQFVIAAQALAMVLVAPSLAKRYAHRRSASVTWPSICFGLGTFVAFMDYVVLSTAIKREATDWNFGILLDDLVYGILSAVGVVVLFVLDRAEKKAPPIAEAAITSETPSQANRSRLFDIVVTVLALGAMVHAFLYARRQYQTSQLINGEREVDASGPVKKSPDGMFMYWLPDDVFESHDVREVPPYGNKVNTHSFSFFTHPRTYLSIEYWPRSPETTIRQLCPAPNVTVDEATCELDVVGGHRERLVLAPDAVFHLRVHDKDSAAGQRFIKEFRVLPPTK